MCVYLLQLLISLPVDLDFVPGSSFFLLLYFPLRHQERRRVPDSLQSLCYAACLSPAANERAESDSLSLDQRRKVMPWSFGYVSD